MFKKKIQSITAPSLIDFLDEEASEKFNNASDYFDKSKTIKNTINKFY